jgi:integrase/recombinase XerD
MAHAHLRTRSSTQIELLEKYATGTVNVFLSAIRCVSRESWKLGQIDDNTFLKIINVKSVRGDSKPSGRALSIEEKVRLISVCADQTVIGTRDLCIISLMLGCGLRRSEVANLDLSDYDREEGILTVRGKGRTIREIPIPEPTIAALEDWISLRGNSFEPLFMSVYRGGKFRYRRLIPDSVAAVIYKRAEQAGMPDITCHDLRRDFVTSLLDAGNDLSTVSKLAGHQDPATTKIYDRRGLESLRKAIRTIQIPYPRRE